MRYSHEGQSRSPAPTIRLDASVPLGSRFRTPEPSENIFGPRVEWLLDVRLSSTGNNNQRAGKRRLPNICRVSLRAKALDFANNFTALSPRRWICDFGRESPKIACRRSSPANQSQESLSQLPVSVPSSSFACIVKARCLLAEHATRSIPASVVIGAESIPIRNSSYWTIHR